MGLSNRLSKPFKEPGGFQMSMANLDDIVAMYLFDNIVEQVWISSRELGDVPPDTAASLL
jgi:hypothetical protein